MVNQVELSLISLQPAALGNHEVLQRSAGAWAPLGGGRHKPYENEMLQRIADTHKNSCSGCPALECAAWCHRYP